MNTVGVPYLGLTFTMIVVCLFSYGVLLLLIWVFDGKDDKEDNDEHNTKL